MNLTNRKKSLLTRSILLPFLACAMTLITATLPNTSRAAGLLIADGGFGGVLEIKEHDVQVTINNGIAVTKITEIFHNTENRQVEALYTFPVPKHASVANFSMWINGKEIIGEVLEKERARQIYNSYKQVRRDPGLLEQVDYKRFEMRIFPIAAGADQKVEITYYQELEIDHDELTYVYPLATVTEGAVNSATTGRFSFQLEATSAIPITAIDSPSHPDDIVFINHSDSYTVASLEQKEGSLADDVVIRYSLSRPHSGIDLITSKTPGEDGFFYLTVTAGEELAKNDIGMDYIFLLDISGSMSNNNKLQISNRSIDAFVKGLDEKDRFEVMTFNVQPNTLFNALTDANDTSKAEAAAFLATQSARGGTILAPALTTAYRYGDPDRALNVIVLSDGMTEQKERQQLMQLIAQRPSYARVFCIGIGNEINRPLLEQMAHDSGGLAAFVSGSDDFTRQAKAFRRKLMRPAISSLALSFDGVDAYDVSPAKLPNLYHGSPVRIYGRYRGAADALITLSGQVMGKDISQAMRLPFPKKDTSSPEIERMWAQKRIEHLLKQADRTNARQNVIDDVVDLGESFSIVTEYTSFLVLENDNEYKRWKIERRNLQRMARDRSVQNARQMKLAQIRQKALQNIGPATAARRVEAQSQEVKTSQAEPVVKAPQTSPQPTQQPDTRRQSRDINFGSGAVGPLFVGLAMLMRRRKSKKC